jgi:DNA repair protein RadC
MKIKEPLREEAIKYWPRHERPRERLLFTVFFLTSKNEILAIEELFRGTINTSAVHPREVVKRALQHGAAALICAHNHPSGNPEPSPQDRMLTRELKEACRLMEIALLDHLVIGHNRYWSFAEHGEL